MTLLQARKLVNKLTEELSLPHIVVRVDPNLEPHGAIDYKPRPILWVRPETLRDPAASLVISHEVAHVIREREEPPLPRWARSDRQAEDEESAADALGVDLLKRVGHPLPTFNEVLPFLLGTVGPGRTIAYSHLLPMRKERAA
jgi:hypothetical protein